jgi:glycolate oxidase
VFQPDADVRHEVMFAILRAGMALGGAISAEHGIGKEKREYFLALEDPVKIALMHRIKAAFDPNGILNPGTLLS